MKDNLSVGISEEDGSLPLEFLPKFSSIANCPVVSNANLNPGHLNKERLSVLNTSATECAIPDMAN